MTSVNRPCCRMQPFVHATSWIAAAILLVVVTSPTLAQEPLAVEDSTAKAEKDMKSYTELIEHTDIKIELVPIKGGEFVMGSPDDEEGREDSEGPQHDVKIAPFWMSKCEITWDAYEVWMFDLDIQRRNVANVEPNARDKAADEYQLSQPTEPYSDMTFGMGKRDYPAICMTQFAARTFCQWLSAKTGRYYRLPTEAEWEYACRAEPRRLIPLAMIQTNWMTTHGTTTTVTRSITKLAKRSPILGGCTICMATFLSGYSTNSRPTHTGSLRARLPRTRWRFPPRFSLVLYVVVLGMMTPRFCEVPLEPNRHRTGKCRIRRFPRASGITRTRCMSVSVLSAR